MARIAGIDLPKDKRIEIGLTYIYGIGRKSAQDILAQTGINPDTRVKDLSDADEQKLRDAIDSYFENATGKYNFIDTAGMRKKSKVDDAIEKYSVLRATMAIERSDVCLIMIDAQDGVTEQDTKVAGLAHEAGKACIIVVNKWDLVEKDGKTMDKMRQDVMRDLSYMT